MQDDRKSRPLPYSPLFPFFLFLPFFFLFSLFISSFIPNSGTLSAFFGTLPSGFPGERIFSPEDSKDNSFSETLFSMRSGTKFDQRLENKERILFRTPRPLFPQQM